MKFDAKLTNWTFLYGTLIGEISDDSKGRFKDGVTVRTSEVRMIGRDPENGNLIASTKNTDYLLVL